MDSNIIDQAKGLVTPEMLQKVASSTGESPENINKAIHGAFPTLVGGLAHRASTPGGVSSLVDALKSGSFTGAGEKPDEGRGGAEAQEGQGLVSKIFGDRGAQVTEALAAHSGIKSSSASHILAMAAPLVAGLLGRELTSGGAGGLVQKLTSHKEAISKDPHTPSGLAGALGSLGTGSKDEPAAAVPSRRPAAEGEDAARNEEPRRAGEPRWVEQKPHGVQHRRAPWAPLLILGAIALGVWGMFGALRGRVADRGVTERQPVMTAPSVESRPAPGPDAGRAGATQNVESPNGNQR
jgi:hypothetical protein